MLEAATLEFAEKGLSGARVDEIARRSNANKRMLYHYFGSKNELYLAVMESAYKKIRAEELDLDLTNMDPVTGMRELVRFTWHYYLKNPEFIHLLNTENLHKARFISKSKNIPKLHSPLVATIKDLLKRGQKDGVFRAGVDPVQLYITIAALGYFYQSNSHTLSSIFGRNLMQPADLEARDAHSVDVVLGYLRP